MNSLFKGIRNRLLSMIVVPFLGFVILIAVSTINLSSVVLIADESFKVTNPKVSVIGEVLTDVAQIGYYLWAGVGNNADPALQADFVKRAEASLQDFTESVQRYQSMQINPAESEALKSLEADLKVYSDGVSKMMANIKQNNPEALAETREMLVGDWYQSSLKVRDGFSKQLKLIEEHSETQSHVFDSLVSRVKMIIWIVSGIAILTMLMLMIFMTNKIVKSLASVSSELAEVGGKVSNVISQLSGTGQSLSQSSLVSASSVEETVASLEEMSSMLSITSQNAKHAAELSVSSKTAAQKGEEEIRTLISQMHEISSASKKIEEIINVIDDIAFQTNLLALNAAVEAARAGEQGKGFAVVAEAVRTLAQRSSVAAKDISNLIRDSVGKIEMGANVADNSGSAMSEILASVQKVSDLSNEIATASAEQTNGVQQITKAMNTLDQGIQGNAASSSEIATTADTLNNQSERMSTLLKNLDALVTGSSQDNAA